MEGDEVTRFQVRKRKGNLAKVNPMRKLKHRRSVSLIVQKLPSRGEEKYAGGRSSTLGTSHTHLQK